MKRDKLKLAIDFDGVLSLYENGWQGAAVINDSPTPGAMEFLAAAVDDFTVCVFSSRSAQPGGEAAMRQALLRWLTDALGEERASQVFVQLEWPHAKPAAFLSIDDRAIQFQGVWPSMQALRDFEPWNRRSARDDGLSPSERAAVLLTLRKAHDLCHRGVWKDDAEARKRGGDVVRAIGEAWPDLPLD